MIPCALLEHSEKEENRAEAGEGVGGTHIRDDLAMLRVYRAGGVDCALPHACWKRHLVVSKEARSVVHARVGYSNHLPSRAVAIVIVEFFDSTADLKHALPGSLASFGRARFGPRVAWGLLYPTQATQTPARGTEACKGTAAEWRSPPRRQAAPAPTCCRTCRSHPGLCEWRTCSVSSRPRAPRSIQCLDAQLAPQPLL